MLGIGLSIVRIGARTLVSTISTVSRFYRSPSGTRYIQPDGTTYYKQP